MDVGVAGFLKSGPTRGVQSDVTALLIFGALSALNADTLGSLAPGSRAEGLAWGLHA